jgi:hypothetical protein
MAQVALRLTIQELETLVGRAVEERLLELIGDPDGGLVIREPIRKRLLRQKLAVSKGKSGKPFEDVVRRLNILTAR